MKAIRIALISIALAACSGTTQAATTTSSPAGSTDTTTTTTGQPGPRVAYLNEVLDVVEAHGYYAARVDFPAWRQRIAAQDATHPITDDEMQQIVSQILNDLGDHHSSWFNIDDANTARNNDTNDTPPPTGKLLPDQVGYLQLPTANGDIGTPAYTHYVTPAHELLQQPACGWIIDLRGNPGGSAFAMVGAVAPLLGPGTFLGYQTRDHTIEGYTITDVTLTDTTGAHLDTNPSPTPAQRNATNTAPVAILTDGDTASAAEAVEVAFIGRALTRSFGAPTYGIPTGNDFYDLSDGSGLNLTVGVSIDRLGHTHEGPLVPDVRVAAAGVNDAVLDAAHAWLAGLPACVSTP
jgi:C-terminal processing protease CtpA/Prc